MSLLEVIAVPKNRYFHNTLLYHSNGSLTRPQVFPLLLDVDPPVCVHTLKPQLSSPESFPPESPCFGCSCKGSRTVFPLRESQFLCQAPCRSLGSNRLEGMKPCKGKKAVSGCKKKKAPANELLLIGRSSIRETLHYLLTRCCVLKGRTVITNWTWGRGGVSCCRGGRCPECLCICFPLLVCSERKGELTAIKILPPASLHYGKVWRNTQPKKYLKPFSFCRFCGNYAFGVLCARGSFIALEFVLK